MIYYVTGDLLLSRAQAVAHGIAPLDHFDQGLARQLRESWPSMVKDYRHALHQHALKSGEIWVWTGVDDQGQKRMVINLLTQEMKGDGAAAKPAPAKVTHVSHCLKALAQYIERAQLSSIALPRLATGVGGLAWSEVKPLIEQHLGPLGTQVYVYECYQAGVAAEE